MNNREIGADRRAKIKDFLTDPTCGYSNPPPVFVRADPEAGCTWARVIMLRGHDDLFVLSPRGVRYYGIFREWAPGILLPGDAGYEKVRTDWQRALEGVG